MGRFVINCDEAAILSDKNEYGELNSKDQFRLKLHHGYCLSCRAYAKMNARFTRKLNKLQRVRLSHEQKDKLRQQLREAMDKKKN